nr:hypothetical protein [Tanacetum cinerariifolium]
MCWDQNCNSDILNASNTFNFDHYSRFRSKGSPREVSKCERWCYDNAKEGAGAAYQRWQEMANEDSKGTMDRAKEKASVRLIQGVIEYYY